MRWMRYSGALTVALLSVLVVSDAYAAGFFLPGRGVKPLGRGGAYVASSGQDLNALWYNPANLAGMEELQLTIDLSLIELGMEFTRAPRTTDNGDTVTFTQLGWPSSTRQPSAIQSRNRL